MVIETFIANDKFKKLFIELSKFQALLIVHSEQCKLNIILYMATCIDTHILYMWLNNWQTER